ncbi:hypothetical protein [Methylobacterium sp. Leaf99]|nr:hypothetical protein [Methylobacterium sp. Leaf99]
MTELAATAAPARDLWRSMPIDLLVSVAAVILAGGLAFLGILP